MSILKKSLSIFFDIIIINMKKQEEFVVGVDEVGRGPLAGPICFGFMRVPKDTYLRLKKDKNLPKSGLDSKKIKKEDREKFSKYLYKLKKEKVLDFYITNFGNVEIDKFGLVKVIKKSMEKGLKKINAKNEDFILLDGGLKLDKNFLNQKTIIKGDEKEKVIAWASILAKVYRDSLMEKYSKKYPEYGFHKNVGYGTKEHLSSLKKFGKTKIHRQSFLKL